jgi:ABC-type multidrug transport system ATPase subunit
VSGKFLRLDGQRFLIKGVSYGIFAPNSDGELFPEPARVARDFESIAEVAANTVRTGGERQRVAVARAFLKNAPILILDEPTSSIDSKTEAVILAALDRLMVGRTTFLVAHRLSTLRSVSKILVLDAGRIVEQGTDDQLLALHGVYRQLHDVQTGRDKRTPAARLPVTAGSR